MKTTAAMKTIRLLARSLFAALVPVMTQAAVFNISNGDVAGLIAAINAANASAGADTINLAAGGTYTLTTMDNSGYYGATGLPVITSPITINGNGATVQRSSAPATPDFRIFLVSNGPSQLTLNSLTVRGGKGIADGWGGNGLLNTGIVRLENCTVTQNTGGDGGGILNYNGTLTVLNSTISYNTGYGGRTGGGIWNLSSYGISTVAIINSTIFENRADGAPGFQGRGDAVADSFSLPGSIIVKNSILASPTQGLGNDLSIAGGVVTSLGHNIVGDASGALIFTGPGDLNSINPMLGPLAANGGPTQTHSPLPGSPAINAVPLAYLTDAIGNPVTTDQRGVARPQGAAGDIGAVELQTMVTCSSPMYQKLKSFGFGSPSPGAFPVAGLIQGLDGALYGTAQSGGSFGAGTVFKLNPDGTGFTVLKNFDSLTTGDRPTGTLIQGADGALYGTAAQGGSSGFGTVFKLNPDGTGFIVLKHFDSSTTGEAPWDGLIQGADGALYGTAVRGGTRGYGTVFKLNPDGTGFTVLKSFDLYTTGGGPLAGVMQGTDGALYGTAPEGGSGGAGTIFKLNPNGTGFTVLLNFDFLTGAFSLARLIQRTDGALYGTASQGGLGYGLRYGTVFKLNMDGSGFVVLKKFDNEAATSHNPYARLMEGTDGSLYGTTAFGGDANVGTVFRLVCNSPPPDTTPPLLSGVPGNIVVQATGPTGAIVTYPTPTANDLVDGARPVVCAPPSGSTFALGVTTVTCTATDGAGNVSAVTFTVTVRDTTPPVLSGVTGNIVAEATGPTGAVVIFSTPTAIDAVDGARQVVCLPPSGTTFPLGLTTVTSSASDTRGNTASASFTVTVRDTTSPTTEVDKSVDGNGSTVVWGGSTLSGAIAIELKGADAVGLAGFECRLDGAPFALCNNPVSYAGLAAGTHTFEARAYDAAGNRDASPASFTWSVITTGQAIQNLMATVNGMNLAKGVANSLTAPLSNIDPSNPAAACGKMGAFVNQVNAAQQTGKLSAAQAGQLLRAAAAIRTALGC